MNKTIEKVEFYKKNFFCKDGMPKDKKEGGTQQQ